MVPEHLRPTFPDGLATLPRIMTGVGAAFVGVAETTGGISLTLGWGPERAVITLADNLARRLAEQILFLVDGTVIVGRDVTHG